MSTRNLLSGSGWLHLEAKCPCCNSWSLAALYMPWHVYDGRPGNVKCPFCMSQVEEAFWNLDRPGDYVRYRKEEINTQEDFF